VKSSRNVAFCEFPDDDNPVYQALFTKSAKFNFIILGLALAICHKSFQIYFNSIREVVGLLNSGVDLNFPKLADTDMHVMLYVLL
jgi:hypothetical protein